MKSLFFIILTSFSLFIVGCTDRTEPSKNFKIGIIQYTNINAQALIGFKDKLASLGYIEGKNVTYIDYGYADSIEEIQPKLKKVMEQKPDIIFSSTTPASISAYEITKASMTPVVFAPVNNPVKAGITNNLRIPGEHITGVTLAPSDGKRLEWLTLLSKDIKQVLVPYNPKDMSSIISIESITKAADDLDIELTLRPLNSKAALQNLLTDIPDNIQAIYLPRDGMIVSRNKDFIDVCLKNKIVLSTAKYEHVLDGATTGYGFIGYMIGKQAGRMVASILNGTKAGDMPVETAEDFFFVNLEVVNKIGLHVENNILRQAYKAK